MKTNKFKVDEYYSIFIVVIANYISKIKEPVVFYCQSSFQTKKKMSYTNICWCIPRGALILIIRYGCCATYAYPGGWMS